MENKNINEMNSYDEKELNKLKSSNSYQKFMKHKIIISESDIANKVAKVKNHVSTLTKETKADLLIQAIKHLDLTSLGLNDSTEQIKQLCLKAANPMDTTKLNQSLHTAAICIYPTKVKLAVDIFKRESIKGIKIASVGAGFPTGKFPLKERLEEIKEAVKSGADEIDVVINRDLVARQEWTKLLYELMKMKEACQNATMKVILSTGELGNMENVYMVSVLAMIAGADFIKTSTGKEAVNATLPVGIIMCRAIKDFFQTNHKQVGFKPAGGIKTAEDVINWLMLIKCELGENWLVPELFRIGASSVLDDIVKYYNDLTSKV